MEIAVVLEPAEEGGFTVVVPALPGCFSDGATQEEALQNIREAIEVYIETLEEDYTPKEGSSVLKIRL